MDNFYREFPFASYKIHQLWVQSILDEEKEQGEAERKKEKELVEIKSPRSIISIEEKAIEQKKRMRQASPSNDEKVKSPSKKPSDSKSCLIKKQPIGQKKQPSLALHSDAKKVNSQKPKKKLKYTIDESIRIDLYQRCPFSSYSYHEEWVKGLVEKEQRDEDKKKKRSSSKCYESDLSEMSASLKSSALRRGKGNTPTTSVKSRV